MSSQSTPKPSLQGVRIKARKRDAASSAKHEPTVFRDQLTKHLESVPEGDFDAIANKLIQAGSTIEYSKYAEAFFELVFVGGLLQPGGSFLDETAPLFPFTIAKAQIPSDVDHLKKFVEVLNKLIRRYKYLQRPLESEALPTLLQYMHRWSAELRDKIALIIGLLFSQGLANTACLNSLTKDHLLKNDVSLQVISIIFRGYLNDQSMDHLAKALKAGGIKDLLLFFPANKREGKVLEEYFKSVGLPQVSEWYIKKQNAANKEAIISEIRDLSERGEATDEIVKAIQSKQEESPLPESELVACIWQGLIATVDWSARPDQIEGLALREVTKYAPILEPFCNGPKTEVALINTVQVYCYEDTRIIKAFPQILKVLYNKDCVSDQAIIYWWQKGSKPQGRQHFIKSTEPLVKFLQQQDDSDEEEEEEED